MLSMTYFKRSADIYARVVEWLCHVEALFGQMRHLFRHRDAKNFTRHTLQYKLIDPLSDSNGAESFLSYGVVSWRVYILESHFPAPCLALRSGASCLRKGWRGQGVYRRCLDHLLRIWMGIWQEFRYVPLAPEFGRTFTLRARLLFVFVFVVWLRFPQSLAFGVRHSGCWVSFSNSHLRYSPSWHGDAC